MGFGLAAFLCSWPAGDCPKLPIVVFFAGFEGEGFYSKISYFKR